MLYLQIDDGDAKFSFSDKKHPKYHEDHYSDEADKSDEKKFSRRHFRYRPRKRFQPHRRRFNDQKRAPFKRRNPNIYIPPPVFPFLHRVPGPPYPGPPPRAPNKPLDQTRIHPSNNIEVYEAPPTSMTDEMEAYLPDAGPTLSSPPSDTTTLTTTQKQPTVIVVQQPSYPYHPMNLLAGNFPSVEQPYATVYEVGSNEEPEKSVPKRAVPHSEDIMFSDDTLSKRVGSVDTLTSTNIISRVPAPTRFGGPDRKLGGPLVATRRRPAATTNSRMPPPRRFSADRRNDFGITRMGEPFKESPESPFKDKPGYQDVQSIIDNEFRDKFDGFPKIGNPPMGHPPNIFRKGVPMLTNDKNDIPNTVYVKPPPSFGSEKPPIRRPPPKHPGVKIPGVSHPPDSGSIQDIIQSIDKSKDQADNVLKDMMNRRNDFVGRPKFPKPPPRPATLPPKLPPEIAKKIPYQKVSTKRFGSYDPAFMGEGMDAFGEGGYDSSFVDSGFGGHSSVGYKEDPVGYIHDDDFGRDPDSYNPNFVEGGGYNSGFADTDYRGGGGGDDHSDPFEQTGPSRPFRPFRRPAPPPRRRPQPPYRHRGPNFDNDGGPPPGFDDFNEDPDPNFNHDDYDFDSHNDGYHGPNKQYGGPPAPHEFEPQFGGNDYYSKRPNFGQKPGFGGRKPGSSSDSRNRKRKRYQRPVGPPKRSNRPPVYRNRNKPKTRLKFDYKAGTFRPSESVSDSDTFSPHPYFPESDVYEGGEIVIPPVFQNKVPHDIRANPPGPDIFEGHKSLYTPFGSSKPSSPFTPSRSRPHSSVHTFGKETEEIYFPEDGVEIINTISELSQGIPKGRPGYQYQEVNFREPVGGSKSKKKPTVINPSDYTFFAQPPQILSDTYSDNYYDKFDTKRPPKPTYFDKFDNKVGTKPKHPSSQTRKPFEAHKKPSLSYNLTPSKPSFVGGDIYEGVTIHDYEDEGFILHEEEEEPIITFDATRPDGPDYTHSTVLGNVGFGEDLLKTEKNPVKIGLDVYPMTAGGNKYNSPSDGGRGKNDNKHELLLHLNLFSKKPKNGGSGLSIGPFSYNTDR